MKHFQKIHKFLSYLTKFSQLLFPLAKIRENGRWWWALTFIWSIALEWESSCWKRPRLSDTSLLVSSSSTEREDPFVFCLNIGRCRATGSATQTDTNAPKVSSNHSELFETCYWNRRVYLSLYVGWPYHWCSLNFHLEDKVF